MDSEIPQIFRIGSYIIYIWSNEGLPTEPIHVHISEGPPSKNATKVWITKNKKMSASKQQLKNPEARPKRYS